jgi:hypothetical protein
MLSQIVCCQDFVVVNVVVNWFALRCFLSRETYPVTERNGGKF